MHGGYREGSGRSKCGYYKGIYCGSTYELCWVIYNLDHNIPFKRFPGALTEGNLKYYPDFLIAEDSIIEIKGYHTPEVDRKCKLARDKGYKIQVLYKEDLKEVFAYVREKYNIPSKEKFEKLYDGYKPKHILVCEECNSTYTLSKLKDKRANFCSRTCVGKFRMRENRKNPDIVKRMEINRSPLNTPTKLSPDQVIEIFHMDGAFKDIASKFDINKSMVSHIKSKRVHKKILENL